MTSSLGSFNRPLRYALLVANSLAAVILLVQLCLGSLSWPIQLPMFLLFVATAAYIAPYNKWLAEKTARTEVSAISLVVVLAFLVWLGGAVGLEWAKSERFVGLIYLAFAISGLVYLRHLPRVRKWDQE